MTFNKVFEKDFHDLQEENLKLCGLIIRTTGSTHSWVNKEFILINQPIPAKPRRPGFFNALSDRRHSLLTQGVNLSPNTVHIQLIYWTKQKILKDWAGKSTIQYYRHQCETKCLSTIFSRTSTE